jgi:uncharacterized membrane protein
MSKKIEYKINKPVIVKTYSNKSNKKRRVAYQFDYSKLFWIFFIGCFLGVVFETLYCLLMRRHFESRVGVIYGPFNPVYGFGAVLLTICLKWLSAKRDLWIFLGSSFIGGAFEYFCSWCQELAFGTVSWEYSHTQYNFHGRTNVMYAFFWGLLGLLWVKELYPRLSSLIDHIPKKANAILTIALSIFMFLNMLISLMAVERQSQRRLGVTATNALSQFLDRQYPDEFLEGIYPNMMVVEKKTS